MLAKSAEEKERLEKLSETEILAETQNLYGDKAEKSLQSTKMHIQKRSSTTHFS